MQSFSKNLLSSQISPEISSTRDVGILVVEDERIIAMDLKDRLISLGYRVVAIASSGESAIEKVAELRPDLVLMDIRLKRNGIDGIQAAEKIWTMFQVPVIYVTGHSDHGTLDRAKLTAPFGYILKPVKEPELYIAIESAIRRYEREHWFSVVLAGIGDGVIAVNAEGQVEYLNPMAESLTGWRLEAAQNRSLDEVFQLLDEPTQQLLENPAMSVLREQRGGYMAEEAWLVHREGRQVPIASSVAPFRDRQGNLAGVVIVFQDITERRLARQHQQAEQKAKQLQQRMDEVQQLSRLKDDFMSTVSHELRSPLVDIRMATQMVQLLLQKQGLGSTDEASSPLPITNYLQIISDQCDQEIVLINDLLDLQRLESGIYSIEWTTIHLQTWLPHLLESFHHRAQTHNLHLKIEIPEDLPPILSDLFSLTRIFTELVTNAIKYTPSGENIILNATLQCEPSSSTSAEATSLGDETRSDLPCTPKHLPDLTNARRIEVRVMNTGIEIPQGELPKIFQKFHRLSEQLLEQQWQRDGSGLGLALVKNLVNYLGGQIRAESEANQITFVLNLPSLDSQ